MFGFRRASVVLVAAAGLAVPATLLSQERNRNEEMERQIHEMRVRAEELEDEAVARKERGNHDGAREAAETAKAIREKARRLQEELQESAKEQGAGEKRTERPEETMQFEDQLRAHGGDWSIEVTIRVEGGRSEEARELLARVRELAARAHEILPPPK